MAIRIINKKKKKKKMIIPSKINLSSIMKNKIQKIVKFLQMNKVTQLIQSVIILKSLTFIIILTKKNNKFYLLSLVLDVEAEKL